MLSRLIEASAASLAGLWLGLSFQATTPTGLFEWLQSAGLPGAMAVFIFALHKGWIVTGREHQFVRDLLRRATSTTERAVVAGERIAEHTDREHPTERRGQP